MDDTVAQKPHSDENDLVCWHYDHTTGKTVKGIGLMTVLYHNPNIGDSGMSLSLPAEFQLIDKTEQYVNPKDGKTKRRSELTKNERYRKMLKQAKDNRIPFKYVLNDVWFASAENMNFVKHDLNKEFVMPLKTNRKVALSADDKRQATSDKRQATSDKRQATSDKASTCASMTWRSNQTPCVRSWCIWKA